MPVWRRSSKVSMLTMDSASLHSKPPSCWTRRSGYTHFRNSLWFTPASFIQLCSFSTEVNFPFCFPLSFYSQYPCSLFSFFLYSVPFDFLSLLPPLSEVRNPILSDFLSIHLKYCSHCAPHILLLSAHHFTCKNCVAVTNNVRKIKHDWLSFRLWPFSN